MNLEYLLAELERTQSWLCQITEFTSPNDTAALLLSAEDTLEVLIRDVRSEVLANPGSRA